MPGAFRFDVLGIGCAAVDDVLYVGSFPEPDTKARVLGRERHCGGLTAVALVAASRLGARCAFAGALDRDPLSRYVVECLCEEGVDTSHVVQRAGARPVHSTIIVDRASGTRTILFDLDGVIAADPELPAAGVIRSARVLVVDHTGGAGAARAARVAREGGIPVVADLEDNAGPAFDELLSLADHLIVSHSFATTLTGEASVAAAAAALVRGGRAAVVVTCGAEGAWYVDRLGGAPCHQAAFRVEVVDTTGCGDVYHGAYACALAEGAALPMRVRFAAAAAALKATRRGGRAGCPDRASTDRLLNGGSG